MSVTHRGGNTVYNGGSLTHLKYKKYMSEKLSLRSRRWVFTVNNYEQEDLDHLSAMKTDYLIYGFEKAPTTGTPHLQGYAVFPHQKTLRTLKKHAPRAHWQIALGTHSECIAYCRKEDKTPFVRGEEPKDRKKRIRAKAILSKDLINGQRILATERIILGMEMEKEMLLEIKNNCLEKPRIIYIHGASGTGKSYFALQSAVNEFGVSNVATLRFDKSGFAHCGNPQAPCLVMLEFRPSCIDAVTFLELTDGYGIHLNVKHGSVFIRPACVYICSILEPQEIYKEEINKQFLRRISKIINKDIDPYVDFPNHSDEESDTIELPSD